MDRQSYRIKENYRFWANDCDEDLLRGWAETARALIIIGGLKTSMVLH